MGMVLEAVWDVILDLSAWVTARLLPRSTPAWLRVVVGLLIAVGLLGLMVMAAVWLLLG